MLVRFVLCFAVFSCVSRAQLLTTTLVNAPDSGQSQIILAASTGLTVGSELFVDREAMRIYAQSGTVLSVQRGVDGTRAVAHAAGATVYAGPSSLFWSSDQSGYCVEVSTTPRVAIPTGLRWYCTNNQWAAVNGASGVDGSIQIAVDGGAANTARTIVDFLTGTAFTPVVTDTGTRIQVQNTIAPGVQTKLNDQTSSHLLCAAGSTTTLTCSMSPTLTVYTDKMLVNLCVTGTVTGATTLDIDGLGAQSVLTAAGANPGASDLVAGCRLVTYFTTGTAFKLPASGGAALSTTGDVVMRPGGCYNSGSGVYPDWGLSGGATATPCIGPSNSQAGLTLTNTGTPELSYYFRLPSDWTSAGNTFVARIADQTGASSATNMKFDVALSCPAAGSVNATTFSFNAATSYNGAVVANGSANDYTFSGLNVTGCVAGGFAVLKIGRDNTGVTPTNYSAGLIFLGGTLRYTRQ